MDLRALATDLEIAALVRRQAGFHLDRTTRADGSSVLEVSFSVVPMIAGAPVATGQPLRIQLAVGKERDEAGLATASLAR